MTATVYSFALLTFTLALLLMAFARVLSRRAHPTPRKKWRDVHIMLRFWE